MSSSSSANSKTTYADGAIRVLLMESISDAAADHFTEAGFVVERVHRLTEDELVERIADVSVIGVRSKTKVTKRVLDAAKRLKAVGCFCIGTDQTDLKEAALHGVPVFNAPFANTRSVAELVVAEIIMLARQASDRNMECHRGEWRKRSQGCHEVRGKSLGLVGYGHVGSQVSILAESLGMRVSFFDVDNKLALGNAQKAESLDSVLTTSDFVSLHVPRTPETVNMIGEAEIARMRKGSYLINASRGTVVDAAAAAKALRSGHLAGGAFDVFPSEPGSAEDEFKSPLRGCPNTILTPHVGGSTEEAQAGIGDEVARKIARYIRVGDTSDAVNFPAVAVPLDPTAYRITNAHRNVPGVLHGINQVLRSVNVRAQALRTNANIGYVVVDVDADAGPECLAAMSELPNVLKVRSLAKGF